MNDVSNTPKVSVIIPCYNEPVEVFRKSLDSVVNQTLKEIEIIIILDNPENEELANIIGEYQRECDRILLLTPEKNLGRGKARNLGITKARGKYIAIHDADDVDFPERLEKQYNYMEGNPDICAMISRVIHVDGNGTKKDDQPKGIPKGDNSFFRMPFNHPTFFIKADVMREIGGYEELNFGEDLNLWYRLYFAGHKLGYQDTVVTNYLAPEDSNHSEYIEKMREWNRAQLLRYFSNIGKIKAVRDVHFHRMGVRAILDYMALSLGDNFYQAYKLQTRKCMDIIRKYSKRNYS